MLKMLFTRRALLFCCLVTLGYSFMSQALSAENLPESAQKPIIEQALIFVQLLDKGRPLDAWSRTTLYFRKKLPPQRWQRLYRNQRQRFGRPVERRVGGYRFFSSFEKAADGLYLQVRFLTDFEARKGLTERVMMYKDYDGRWRVIGYFLERE